MDQFAAVCLRRVTQTTINVLSGPETTTYHLASGLSTPKEFKILLMQLRK